MTTERTSPAMADAIGDAIAKGELPALAPALPALLPLPAPVPVLPRVETPESLVRMLQHRRPAGSETERDFIRRFIKPLGDVTRDKRGNLYKRIGDAPVLWSAHTDTVHSTGGFQRLLIRKNGAEIALAHDEKLSTCLGGDNTAGVWLLCEMARAEVPGLYVFHRAEEHGRLGSQWIAKNAPEVLTGIKAAIAFDRRYESSVITRQSGRRSCSDAFADSLIALLGLQHQKDTGGSYTDTYSYLSLVGECTNVSAGFAYEHTDHETQNVRYLLALRDKLIALDAAALGALAFTRQAGEVEPVQSYSYADYYGGADYADAAWSADWQKRWDAGAEDRKRAAYVRWWDDALWMRDSKSKRAAPHVSASARAATSWAKPKARAVAARSFRTIRDEIEGDKRDQRLRSWSDTGWALDDESDSDSSAYSGRAVSVADVLRRYPESVGAWLEDQAVTADELLTMIARHKLAHR